MVADMFWMAAAYFGAAVLAYHALALLNVLYKTLLASGPKLTKKYGEWAVVTGATDGVGKAMCFELARKGCSVMLISRSEAKLKAVKAEITEQYPSVKVDYAVADFSKLTPTVLAFLKAKLDPLDIGTLVNNVGVSYDFCQWFHELSDAEVRDMLAINIESVTCCADTYAPGAPPPACRTYQRRRAACPGQGTTARGRTRASRGRAISTAYRGTPGHLDDAPRAARHARQEAGRRRQHVVRLGKGVHFQCQSPYFVATAMTFPNSKVPAEKRATLMTPSPKAYARAAVARIGLDTMTSPYWAHELLLWVQMIIPDAVVGPALLSMHKGIRFHKKNVAKMEEKSKNA